MNLSAKELMDAFIERGGTLCNARLAFVAASPAFTKKPVHSFNEIFCPSHVRNKPSKTNIIIKLSFDIVKPKYQFFNFTSGKKKSFRTLFILQNFNYIS